MCIVQGTAKTAMRGSGVGYKVFDTDGVNLYGVCYGQNTVRARGKWVTCVDLRGRFQDPEFNVGWHVYTKKRDTRMLLRSVMPQHAGHKLVVMKVKYRGAKIEGMGDGGWNLNARVVIAREMFIL